MRNQSGVNDRKVKRNQTKPIEEGVGMGGMTYK
jgi:hypothetical protein